MVLVRVAGHTKQVQNSALSASTGGLAVPCAARAGRTRVRLFHCVFQIIGEH